MNPKPEPKTQVLHFHKLKPKMLQVWKTSYPIKMSEVNGIYALPHIHLIMTLTFGLVAVKAY